MPISQFPKKFTPLELDDLFVELVRFDAGNHTFVDEWPVWLRDAEYKLNPNKNYSIRQHIHTSNGSDFSFIPPLVGEEINLLLKKDGRWRYNNSDGNNYFDLYCMIYNTYGIYAAKKYAEIFGMNYDKVTKNVSGDRTILSCRSYNVRIPETLRLRGVLYKKKIISDIYSKDGAIIGAYIRYESDKDFFYLYGEIKKSQFRNQYDLVLGRPNGMIPLMNENQLIRTVCPVVFFMSLEMANKLSIENNTDSNVITSCLDNDKTDEIDFSSLHGKRVYFISEPTKSSIRKCLEYIDKLQEDSVDAFNTEKIVVDSIRICPIFSPFIDEETGYSYATSADPFERYLAEKCTYGCPDNINLENDSLKVEDFKKMMMDLGVLEGEHHNTPSALDYAQGDIDQPRLSKFGFYAAEDFLSPTQITGFIGSSESGKTMLGYTYAVNLASGNTFMDLEVRSPHRVIYFDRETDSKNALVRIQRIKNAYEVDDELCQQNFVFKSVMIGFSDIPDGDLLNPEVQDWITNEVHKNDSEFIFFDNIHSFGDNLTHQSNWSKVTRFFRELSKGQRSIIFFHHLDNSGQISGTDKIHQLSQNIIEIRSNKYVKKRYPELNNNFKRQDCVMELDFDKAKIDLNRKELIQVWKLDYNVESPSKGNKWELLFTNAEDSPSLATKDEDIPIATEDITSELAIRKFEERLKRSPVLDGTKMEKEWKRDAALVYAIQRHLNAHPPSKNEEAWFTLNEVKEGSKLINLPKLSEQTVRDILNDLVVQKYLDETAHEVKKGKPKMWRYRKDS